MTELFTRLPDENVLRALGCLPGTTYNSPNDVSEQMGTLI